ncbi:MAG: M48 family metalloprotease, partial [Gemmataceae bacterium]
CCDLLLWRTQGAVANAMVVGMIPQARFVILSDRIIEGLEPDELDAVFGHEVGHVRHGHIPYYAAFFLLSATVTAAVAGVAVKAAVQAGYLAPHEWDSWVTLPPIVVMGAYIFLVFGFLSRKCERQADLFGATMTHPGAMIRALSRVAYLNGMDISSGNPALRGRWGLIRLWPQLRGFLRSWQHGTIPERIRFLERIQSDPAVEPAFQRRVFAIRCGLMIALVGALVVLVARIGWRQFLTDL